MHYKKFLIVICLVFVSVPHSYCMPSAVTYTFSGGRFGDNLLAYCHAKWIAYKYNIPLLYKQFEFSDQLVMHALEMHHSNELEQQFEHVITYSSDCIIDVANGALYSIPFFPESIFNRYDTEFPFLFMVDWHDSAFKALLKTMICPIMPSRHYILPPDHVSVAVHVRKGTGWDIPNYGIAPSQLCASHPLRFAPDSFYIEQLQRIARMFAHDHIYVYLFTDHNNPAELAHNYESAVGCDRMVFDCRTEENNEFINVLDDFFALTQFDCLIRSDSNFSFMASRLGNYKIQISPWHGVVNDEETVVDEVCLVIEDQCFIVKNS
jgi:hypothetical protein